MTVLAPPQKQPEALPPSPPHLREYAAQIIATRLDRMLSHTEGVRRGEDTEAVHQMRVWSRRARAALEVFRDCFPGKDYAALEREVKAVTDALGEARDLDVMMEALHKRAAALPPQQRGGIESFIARLQKRREACQQPVVKALKQLEHQDLARRFAELVAGQTPRSAHSSDGMA